jgi:hypothetical protein
MLNVMDRLADFPQRPQESFFASFFNKSEDATLTTTTPTKFLQCRESMSLSWMEPTPFVHQPIPLLGGVDPVPLTAASVIASTSAASDSKFTPAFHSAPDSKFTPASNSKFTPAFQSTPDSKFTPAFHTAPDSKFTPTFQSASDSRLSSHSTPYVPTHSVKTTATGMPALDLGPPALRLESQPKKTKRMTDTPTCDVDPKKGFRYTPPNDPRTLSDFALLTGYIEFMHESRSILQRHLDSKMPDLTQNINSPILSDEMRAKFARSLQVQWNRGRFYPKFLFKKK